MRDNLVGKMEREEQELKRDSTRSRVRHRKDKIWNRKIWEREVIMERMIDGKREREEK